MAERSEMNDAVAAQRREEFPIVKSSSFGFSTGRVVKRRSHAISSEMVDMEELDESKD